MTRPPRCTAGFTLIEMLVALATLGLVMVMLSGGIRFAGRAVVAEERLVDGYVEIEPVRALLRRLVAEAQAIDGTADRLELVAPLPAALGADGIFDIRILREDERLLLDWRARRTPDGVASGTSDGRVELIGGVTGVAFSFLAEEGEASAKWRPMTADRSTPPLLVKLDVSFAAADRRRWGIFVAAPGVDSPLLTVTQSAVPN